MSDARGRSTLSGVVFGAVLLFALSSPQTGAGLDGSATTGPLPLLGPADSEMTLMGAARASADREVWGYRQLPLSVGGVKVGERELAFGPQASAGQTDEQLAFVRYTEASGWRIFDTPVDEAGRPYRGPNPNRLSARVTPLGGGVLVGRDTTRPPDAQAIVIHHDPGGDWQVLAQPPVTALLPGETLAGDGGSGEVAIAAFDEGARTGLFIAPKSTGVSDAVLHYDGTAWTREPVTVPAASASDFTIVAIDATQPANAWALAIPDPGTGRSVVLLERTTPPGGPVWVERDLGSTPFADTATPGLGIAAVAPLGGAAQPLTVTPDGVWIDFSSQIAGVARDVTTFYAIGAGEVTAEWCDDAACPRPLGAQLSRQGGYRSFAWAGPGFGTRVITNPLDVGGSEESNRGTYLRFAGDAFTRLPGAGGSFRPSGAFLDADNGWLEGPIEISQKAPPQSLSAWPVSIRAPLTDVTGAPAAALGALDAQALAVGADGSVARYEPGSGWRREFLLSSIGAVNKATLRGVAWPEPSRAHAVGDLGAMWQWNADDNLWTADPGAPVGFEGNLMDVAFDPADPSRGYAVGRGGVLLRYGKSWEQEQLPAGFEGADLTSIAFAGQQALVAAGGNLLINSGGGWEVDASAAALLDSVRAGDPNLFAVAALPDGGAVAAGRDIVIERDGPESPWRFSSQPLPGSTVVAAAAVRPDSADGEVRAVVSVVPQINYPPADDLPEPDPTVPAPVVPPFAIPGDGYLLRETGDGGWVDEQRTEYLGSGFDRPTKSDPVLGLLLDSGGSGWVVGGWSGQGDAAGRGTSATNSAARAIRTRVRTAAISRYGAGAGATPTATGTEPVPLASGLIRLAVGGHAQCEGPCADLAPQAIGPDVMLAATLQAVASMQGGAGPRALLYTGNRVATGLTPADGARFASLLGSVPSLPVFSALGSNDAIGEGAEVFQDAFADFPAPFGAGAAPAGVSTDGIPGASPGPGARTHYAFDSTGSEGTVRIVVIDNSLGSLAASDGHQNPAEPQLPWLEAVLADARSKRIPVIVMGNRSLNASFTPRLNVADDATEVARVLVDGGASAYVFDRPEENRAMRIPAGGQTTIPSFGIGTLGYRSPVSGSVGVEAPDALFGDGGVLLLELDATAVDQSTNRAPVSVRLIPVLSDLSLEATDGTLLRRSRPALFRGLGRRPPGGDRWGRPSAGTGNPDPSGGDPYTSFPPAQCLVAGCSARITPEYSFKSSDPDIADFVRQDPASSNLRKPFIGTDDKVVTDNTSGLLCPFNAGVTTVTIASGGYSFSQRVEVLRGSVQRPCGTRPLNPNRFTPEPSPTTPPPPPSPQPQPAANPNPAPPPPPVAPAPPTTAPPTPPLVEAPPVKEPPPPAPPPPPVIPPVFVPATQSPLSQPPTPPPPPPPAAIQPLPPGGAPARVYQVEEKREEQAAPEESQAFSRYEPEDDGLSVPPALLGVVLLAALAGSAIRGPGARRRVRPAPAVSRTESTRRS